MSMVRLAFALVLATLLSGCDYAFGDVATRIRYALLRESTLLQWSGNDTVTISLHPDHWPDACRIGQGYRLVLSPYKGGKEVASGDIEVTRQGREGDSHRRCFPAHEEVLRGGGGTWRRTASREVAAIE